MAQQLPTKPRSFRLTDHSVDQLERLQARLRRNQTDVVQLAITHLLATLERQEPVHLEVPSDQDEQDDAGPAQ